MRQRRCEVCYICEAMHYIVRDLLQQLWAMSLNITKKVRVVENWIEKGLMLLLRGSKGNRSI